jgi:hypothetical protein
VGPSQGALHLATAFPRPVWLDHLLPFLKLREAVTLRATSRAMRGIVTDMRADLGNQSVRDLKKILTCFPRAESARLFEDESMTKEEQDGLIAWLKERGNCLRCIEEVGGEDRGPFIRRAWRAGIFKSVKSVTLQLADEDDRDLIVSGLVTGVELIWLQTSDWAYEVERAALGYLRHFPALKTITCIVLSFNDLALPPFIPPSLEYLSLEFCCDRPLRVMGCLPSWIEASGARLRCLDLGLSGLEDDDTARGVRGLLQARVRSLLIFGRAYLYP